jgi:hypothetical protein
MPNGIFPVPPFDSHFSHTAATRPGLAVRIRTWFRRNRLDEELARGVDPATSVELGLRAAQLRSPGARSRFANGLVETLGDARRGEPVSLMARPARASVRDCADDLWALVVRLRGDQPIAIQGAAMTARLLSDGASPLYRNGGQDLQHALQAGRLALDPDIPARQDLPRAA